MARAFFARCPADGRLLILGQTCVCGTDSLWPKGHSASNNQWASVLNAWDAQPRKACQYCQFEYRVTELHDCS